MHGAPLRLSSEKKTFRPATTDPVGVRVVLVIVAVLFVGILLILPLLTVFIESFRKGVETFFEAFGNDDALSAIRLTLLTAAVSVPLNMVFGLMASWAITRFDFRGRGFLISLIDLPLWVSPVVSGLIYVLIFGAQGVAGPWLIAHDIKVIFTPLGIILATIFVTFPFVARNVIPVMESLGKQEEEAALILGANGFQIFFRVTLPKIKWGLLYGVILCNARAMGEFGAVSVVSGHIRGLTNTMPLHIEILYNEYQFAAAFAVASLLSLLALLTLGIKSFAEWRAQRELDSARIVPGKA